MNNKMMRTIPMFVILIAVLVLLTALTTPALALGESYDYDGFPLTTKSSDTINGGVFISYGDNDQMENAKVKPYVTNYSVPNGTPKWAKLYMHLWGGNPRNGGTVNVTFNGHDFDTVVINGTSTDDPQVLGSGCGTWWLFFNVTSHITAGAINKAEASVTSTSMDGRVARMVLIEAYEGGDGPQNLMYWVDDGHMNLHYNSSEHPWCIDYTKAWFNGTVPSGVSEANLTGVWLTGTYGEPDYFYFSPPDAPDAPNGNNINWNISKYSDYQFGAYDFWTGDMSYNDVAMGGGWYNNYFDLHSNTTTNTSTLVDVLKTDNNYAIFWRGHDDNADGWISGAFGVPGDYEGEGYVHPVVAVLVLNLGAQPEKDDLANAEETVKGTRTGSYVDTQASDDVYEAIAEIVRGQKSLLEHKWTVDVTGGSSVTFYVEAYHTVNIEGDDFVFAYSTDDSTYTDMVTVTNTSDTDTYQTYELPSTLSGNVYIRVMDTDRTRGNKAVDTIYIDHLFIRSVLAPPSYDVTVTIDEASQTVKPGNNTTYTVRVKNTGNLEASYNVVMSGTAVDEGTIDVSPLNWNTGTLTPNDENVTTVTVSTTASTPETTYALTATATCVEDVTVNDSATSELVVSSVTNTMHVYNIDMWYTTAGPNYKIYTKVKIVDATDVAVVGATVYLNTTLPDGTNVSSSDVTGDDGTVEFMYGPTKTTGDYTSTVTDVAKDGWTYDSAANVETSKTLTAP